MPRVTNLPHIRALLDRDRAWSAYAIGDLSPELSPNCEWYASDGDAALVLLYRGFSPPILFAIGDPAAVALLVSDIAAPEVSLHLRPDAVAAIAQVYHPTWTRAIWRMVVEPASFRAAPTDDVIAVHESDLEAIEALYADGHRHQEGPTFFYPAMLRQGTFRAIRDGAALVSIAGTHLYSAELGICALGNVYTRRDRRRQGLGARVTSAVVQHAIAQRVSTIVLNVSQQNDGARRVYEQLGFRCHCEFFEGEARRRS